MAIPTSLRARSTSLLIATLIAAGGCWASAASSIATGADDTRQAAVCRTYPTASTGTVTQPAVLLENISTTCGRYNTTTNQMTCTINQTGAPTIVIVGTYNSVADFVDEVRVVPPLSRLATVSMTPAAGPSSLRRNTYDSQGRMIRSVIVTAGTTQTETHSAWDSASRSTRVTFTPAVGPASVTSNAYDDAARTLTITTSGMPGSMTLTFDANGNLSKSVATFSVTTTTNYTVTATDRICR